MARGRWPDGSVWGLWTDHHGHCLGGVRAGHITRPVENLHSIFYSKERRMGVVVDGHFMGKLPLSVSSLLPASQEERLWPMFDEF